MTLVPRRRATTIGCYLGRCWPGGSTTCRIRGPGIRWSSAVLGLGAAGCERRHFGDDLSWVGTFINSRRSCAKSKDSRGRPVYLASPCTDLGDPRSGCGRAPSCDGGRFETAGVGLGQSRRTPEYLDRRLAVRSRVMPLYTPLSGSRLYLVESVQRISSRRALNGQHLQTVTQLITWLEDTVAAHPTPFVWTG